MSNKNIQFSFDRWEEQKTPLSFIVVIAALSVSTIFLTSGIADAFKLNEKLSYLAILLFVLMYHRTICILSPNVKSITLATVALVAILVFMNYNSNATQLIQLVSTFGIVSFVELFCLFKWESKDLFKLGLTLSLLTLLVSYLLLPGHMLQGWNSNSVSAAFPMFVMSICLLWVSDHKLRLFVAGGIFFIFLSLVSQLENRSTLMATLFLGLTVVVPLFCRNKTIFRCFYIVVILVNLLIPFLNDVIADMDVFKSLLGEVAEMTQSGKMGGSSFNGREELWEWSIDLQNESPLFGCYGVRPFYPHNFSMDLLNNFGWVGYITFYIMLISVLEFAYREGSKYNVFLVGLMSVIFLNTFENSFTCCGYLQFFVWVLPAIAIRINHRLIRV